MDNTYDLGNESLRWRNVYLDGHVDIDASDAESHVQFNLGSGYVGIYGNPNGSVGMWDWINGLGVWRYNISSKEFTVWRTMRPSNVRPLSDNAYDLGNDSYRWRNIYYKGTLYGGSAEFSGDVNISTLQKFGLIYFEEAESKSIGSAGTIVDDPTASGGKAVKGTAGGSSGTIVFGPYRKNLRPGSYVVLYRLKVSDNTSASTIANINVFIGGTDAPGTINSMDIRPIDFEEANKWQVFALPVELDKDAIEDYNGVEFRVSSFDPTVGADLYVDWIAVVPATVFLKMRGSRLDGNWIPALDGSYDLGLETLRWRNLYLGSETDSMISVKAKGNAIIKLEADIDNVDEYAQPRVEFYQDGGAIWGFVGYNYGQNYFYIYNNYGDGICLRVGGSNIARVYSDGIVPLADDTYSLGNENLRWRVIYVSTGAGGGIGGIYQNEFGCLAISEPSTADRLEFYRETDGRWGIYNRTDHVWLWYVEEGGTVHTHSIVPFADNAKDLGSESLRWRNGYFSGKLQTGLPVGFGEAGVGSKVIIKSADAGCGQLQIGNPSDNEASICYIPQVTGFGLPPSSNAGYAFVAGVSVWGIGANCWGIGEKLVTKSWVWKVSHTGTVVQKGDLLPASDNAVDIGNESLRWRNGHFAGTVYASQFIGNIDWGYVQNAPLVGVVLAFDDTEATVTGTTEAEVKYFRFVRNSSFFNVKKIRFIVSGYSSSGTGKLKVYIDGTAYATIDLTSTSEGVYQADVDVSSLSDGIHTVSIRLVGGSSSETVVNNYVMAVGLM